MTNNFTQSKENVKISQSKIRPVMIYFWYLTRLVFTMWSTWVLLAVGLLVAFSLNLIPLNFKFGDDAYKFSWIAKICLSWSSVLSIFLAGLIGIMKTINVFLDSQNDGSDLLIVSKPITRAQIIFTRFLFLFALAIVYSIFSLIFFVISLAILGLGNSVFSTPGIKFGVFLAPLLSFIIMGLFALLLSLKFSSKTARVLPIVLSFSGVISATILLPAIATASYSPIENAEKSINNTQSQKEYEFCDVYGVKEKTRKLQATSTAIKNSGFLFIPVRLDKNKKPTQVLSLDLGIPKNNQVHDDKKESKTEDRTVFLNHIEENVKVGKNQRKVLRVWNKWFNGWTTLPLTNWPNWDVYNDEFATEQEKDSSVPTKKEYEEWLEIQKQRIEANKTNFIEMKKEILEKANVEQNFKGSPLFVFLGIINPIYSIVSMSGLSSLSPVETTPVPSVEKNIEYGSLPEYNYSYKLIETSKDSSEELVLSLTERTRLDPLWSLILIWATLATIASIVSIFVFLRKDFK